MSAHTSALAIVNGSNNSRDLLAGNVHVGYYAAMSAARVLFIIIAALSMLHFLAPGDSFGGRTLVQFTHSPYAVLAMLYGITGCAAVYFFRVGNSMQLRIDKGSMSLAFGELINTVISLELSKINHVTVERSYLERIQNLSTLKIYTAGSHKPTIVLPNLHASSVEGLRLSLQQATR